MRRLASKHLRALLWQQAEGRCRLCGEELPDNWHADHIVPWSASPRTNVHEMQALCPTCNCRKGKLMLRRPQKELKDILEEIRAGSRINRQVLVWATCGGGKSLIPVIAGAVGIPYIADRIACVVPRHTLQVQMEKEFTKSWHRRLLGHDLVIRQSTNDLNPSRGLGGYVTTYQALAADRSGINRDEFDARRYILVLDEIHHIEEGGTWHRAVKPLVERAALVILMTGTMERGDGKKIAFVPYREAHQDGVPGVYVDDEGPSVVLRYDRRQALEERAIIPLFFEHLDGKTEWVNRDGQSVFMPSLAIAGNLSSEAVYTALRTDYARELLERCVEDWRGWKATHPRSKLLVVAAGIKEAKTYLGWLQDMGVARSEIATSDDSPAAQAAIERFDEPYAKGSALDALVTVAMAYEGLDNRAITHIACLTHIRSRPWIEQMIARANRVDDKAGPWETQAGFVYGPDDAPLVEIMAQIREDQGPFVPDRLLPPGPGGGNGGATDRDPIIPNYGEATQSWASDLAGFSLDYQSTERARRAMAASNIGGINPAQFVQALEMYQAAGSAVDSATAVMDDEPVLRPSHIEKSLRAGIDEHTKKWAARNSAEWRTLNDAIYRRFGKVRKNMDETELREVWAWLNATYPL